MKKLDKQIVDANNFVRHEGDVMRTMMGNRPKVPAAMRKTDAYMSNDGAHAKDLSRKIGRAFDKKAFPVR